MERKRRSRPESERFRARSEKIDSNISEGTHGAGWCAGTRKVGGSACAAFGSKLQAASGSSCPCGSKPLAESGARRLPPHVIGSVAPSGRFVRFKTELDVGLSRIRMFSNYRSAPLDGQTAAELSFSRKLEGPSRRSPKYGVPLDGNRRFSPFLALLIWHGDCISSWRVAAWIQRSLLWAHKVRP